MYVCVCVCNNIYSDVAGIRAVQALLLQFAMYTIIFCMAIFPPTLSIVWQSIQLQCDTDHVVFDRQRITFEPKWTIPLTDLTLDDKIAIAGGKLAFLLY